MTWRRSGAEPRLTDSDVAPVKLVRTIRAPVAKVYKAWHDPALMRRWLATGDWKVSAVRTDPRIGGAYMFEVVGPQGDVHRTSGEYLELARDERIIKTWSYEGPHGNDTYPSELTGEFRATDPTTTELTVTHRYARDEKVRQLLAEGWKACLDDLARLLEG